MTKMIIIHLAKRGLYKSMECLELMIIKYTDNNSYISLLGDD